MTTQASFMQALTSHPLLCDGGMGTQLIAAGLTVGDCATAWNRDHPDAVAEVHRAYRAAGCRILTTNTFQGSRTALAAHGLAEDTAPLNLAAAQVARRVADESRDVVVFVAADVGPFGGFLEPLGDTSADDLAGTFTEQLAALHAGGADLALIETMSDPAEVAVAVSAAKSVAGWPVIATYAFEKHGGTYGTMMGAGVSTAVEQAIAAGADAVGANCGTSLTLEDYIALAKQLVAAAGGVPVTVQPNAGPPRIKNGVSVHDATPADMADAAAALLDAGVRIVGGCCGTEPSMLAAMSTILQDKYHA